MVFGDNYEKVFETLSAFLDVSFNWWISLRSVSTQLLIHVSATYQTEHIINFVADWEAFGVTERESNAYKKMTLRGGRRTILPPTLLPGRAPRRQVEKTRWPLLQDNRGRQLPLNLRLP